MTDMWQPIETAPKDGTHVLTFSEPGGMLVAFYHPRGSAWTNWQLAEAGNHAEDTELCSKPTHWMPLPSPPPVTRA